MTREKVIERGGGDYGTGVSEERAAAATGYNHQDLCRALGLFRNSESEELVRLALIAAYRRGYLHGTQAEPAAPARPEASTVRGGDLDQSQAVRVVRVTSRVRPEIELEPESEPAGNTGHVAVGKPRPLSPDWSPGNPGPEHNGIGFDSRRKR